jgi:Asp/Glu/hydantoin racemase
LEGGQVIEEGRTDVLVLGCGASLNSAETLQEKLDVAVIDPISVALKIAEDLVKLEDSWLQWLLT